MNVSTPPPPFAHVSVQEQVTRSCSAGVMSVRVVSSTAHDVWRVSAPAEVVQCACRST